MKRCLVAVLVLLIGVSALALAPRPKVAAAADGPCAGLNPVACENQNPGFDAPSGETAQDPTITGFATAMSVNLGETEHFKINTDATSYHIDIYRLGWYDGLGARKMATISPSAPLPQVQPPCMSDATTGLVDCGNWAESASWAVPSNAVSGVYDATLVRDDTGGMNTIVFVVRNDASHSDILVQTSDATWQAYNTYGGNSLYTGSTSAGGTAPGRAYKVSYNRPLGLGNDNNKFWAQEYPMLLFLERNGYDVSYQSDLDTSTRGAAPLEQHKTFLVSGHDEYWSGQKRANVTAARDAGVNLAFFSANTSFWRTRMEPSLDGTPNRTIVCYKETDESAKIDPTNEWTGTYRDPRFSPPAIGGKDPENSLVGTISTVSGTRFDAIQVPAAYSSQRIWRNTSAANLAPGTTYSLPSDSLGYEWDSDLDNGSRPAGLIDLSSTTVALGGNYLLTNFGANASDGTSTHSMTLYKAPSGALVFSDGTINWAQFMDKFHDEDETMEQATVNILADMGAQPDTLESQLVPASASTDTQPPTATITSPLPGATVGANGEPTTVSGTASDVGGGVVAGVEVSTDGGTTWHPASGTTSWSYAWRPSHVGAASLEVRATDDSANTSSPSGSVPITVVPTCPCHLWSSSAVPQVADVFDTTPAELGTQFRADQDGYITGVRFYKGPTNTGLHTGSLWSSTGQLLATATFTNETAQGWQDVQFSQPVPVVQNQTYVVSYHTPNGQFADDAWGFESSGIDSGVLHAPWSTTSTPGVFSDAASSSFPNKTFQASNYWVDVDYTVNTDKPTVVAASPAAGSTHVNLASKLTARISKTISPSSIAFTVTDPDGNTVPGSLSYDASSMTATFTPSSGLPSGELLTATVSGATDMQGLTMDPFSWSFTTGGINACPCTIWRPTDTPTNASAGDTNSVEVGLKFQSDHAGVVTGVRFYKGAANTGTHTGSLWSSSGQLMARTTFTGETASGWQQAQFSSPVEIAPNTTYVISYHAPNGGYSYDFGYFGSGGVDNSPLHALADGTAGPNAVFVYSASPSFPTNGFLASNYWVDPVFGKDTSAPQVIGTSPTPGSTGVLQATNLAVTFDKSVDASGATFRLADPQGNVSAGATSYDDSTHTVTFTPSASLASGVQYTSTISGVRDLSGNAQTPYSWSFTTGGDKTCPCTIWPSSATPTLASAGDGNSVEAGVKFRADEAGTITGVRFYKGAANTGTHTGSLWSSSGQLLATGTFTNETATGWQQLQFAQPVQVAAGTTYVASYHAPNGGYAYDPAYFSSGGQDRPPLHALADGQDGADSVFVYSPSTTFPSNADGGANLWVDVVFQPSALDVTPPVVSGFTPANGATGLSVSTAPSVTFSEAVQPATVSFVLRDAANNVVPGSAGYNAGTRTVTFTPSAALGSSSTYTATVSGAQDLSGNVMVGQSTWSFTTRINSSVTDSTTANFSAGTVGTGAYVSEMSDGEIILAPALGSEFTGTTLPAGWTSTRIQTTGTSVVSGGSVTLDGTRINPTGTYSRPRTLEFSATFQPSTDETAGLGTNLLAGTPEAVFTTTPSGHLHAISRKSNGVQTDTDLGTTYLGAPHTFRIDWNNNVVYSIDGTVVATQAQNITGQLRPVAQDGTVGGAQLAVSWMHLGPYATTGTFTSRVLDGGQPVTWDSLTAVATVPAGAGITVSVRSGNTPTPDGTWTAFTPVGAGGAINQVGRYVQYQVTLTAGTGGTTPALSSIALTNFR
jgi:hypothetical protein